VAIPDDRRAAVRLISPRTSFWITDILSDADAREYIFGRGGSLDFPFPVAAKTGTSEGYHDNWAIGYTRDVTVGVWVGNFDRSPLTNSSGVTGAGAHFSRVMLAAQKRVAGGTDVMDVPLAVPTGDVTRRSICALSGMRAGESCPARVGEWLPAGTADLPCSWHHASEDGVIVVWPPEYRQWAQSDGRSAMATAIGDRRWFTVWRPWSSVKHPLSRRSTIDDGPSTIDGPFDLESARGCDLPDRSHAAIVHTRRWHFACPPIAPAGRIEWTVNGRAVGTSDSDKPLQWPLSPGTHRIVAADDRGRSAETTILVR
jgi:membrane carboxypeptidase/penicillin-binding protein PbpC